MKKHYKIIISSMILIIILLVIFGLFINRLVAPKISIEINENGNLYLKTNINDKNMCVYWETDAGNIKPVTINNELSYTPDNGYFCYTKVDEMILWDIKDYDGYDYSCATIRVYLYKYQDGSSKYVADETISNNEITVQNLENSIKTSSARQFGNPIRADGNIEWGQIYSIYNSWYMALLRYRTGAIIDKNNIIKWESDIPLLCDVYFCGSPPYLSDFNQNKNQLQNVDTALYFFDFYKKYKYMDNNLDYEKQETILTIKAFLYDKKLKTKKHETQISYLYDDGIQKYKKMDE